jgi:hypothetical protein
MADFHPTLNQDGTLSFGPYKRAQFKEYARLHGPVRARITFDLPESGKLRKFFEGAIVSLVAFYQIGMDHRNDEDRRKVREWLKAEFNGEMVGINGRIHTLAKSTKGAAVLGPFVERCMDWLNENYQPPPEALDPDKFKHWRDAVFPSGGPDNYLDYLVELNILKINNDA